MRVSVEAERAAPAVDRRGARLATWLASATRDRRVVTASSARCVTRVPLPGRGLDLEFVDQPARAAQPEAQAVAGGVAVLAAPAAMSGMPGPLSSKVRRTPRARRRHRLDARLAAAAVVERVARELAGGGDHLGLVDQAEARPRPRSARTAWRTRTTSSRRLDRDVVSRHRHRRRLPVRFAHGRRSGPCRARRSSAVRTPGSDRPSSTSVIATAGRMPTTTVSASRMRDIAAMLAEHAADERVDDLERRDVDQHAARAVLTIRDVRSSCSGQREPVVHVDLDRDQQELRRS